MTDILKVFESAYFFLYLVNVYIICQLKRCLFYNYDSHTLSSCLGSFGHMMLCMQFSRSKFSEYDNILRECSFQKVRDSDVMG